MRFLFSWGHHGIGSGTNSVRLGKKDDGLGRGEGHEGDWGWEEEWFMGNEDGEWEGK